MVSVCSMKLESTCHSPVVFGGQHPHEFVACADACLQLWCGCSWPVRSGGETVNGNQAGGHETHIEDNKDPIELRVPAGNHLFIIRRMPNSRHRIASTLLDDLILYFCDSSAIESAVGEEARKCNIAGPTHVVNWLIASHTDWLRSSSLLPFMPRSRALQMSAQNSPSST